MVGRLNQLDVARLESFLFGADRVSLQPVRAPLVELQQGLCFYCGGRLRAQAEVDHFLPWSRYPDDRLDNLVVAHTSLQLPQEGLPHQRGPPARWIRRLSDHDLALAQIADATTWPRHTTRTLGVVRSTYLMLPDGVALWHEGRSFLPSRHEELRGAFEAAR